MLPPEVSTIVPTIEPRMTCPCSRTFNAAILVKSSARLRTEASLTGGNALPIIYRSPKVLVDVSLRGWTPFCKHGVKQGILRHIGDIVDDLGVRGVGHGAAVGLDLRGLCRDFHRRPHRAGL